jgi:carbon monoxide dehydrogenase subunit G
MRRRPRMRSFEASVVIKRPVHEVFDFVSNPDNVRPWQPGVLESRRTSEGPMGVGATYLEVRQSMGRRIESPTKVTRYKPNATLGSSTAGLVPFEGEYTFESIPDGARVTFTARIEVGGFLRLIEPLIVRMFRKDMQSAFATLKATLEARTEGNS